MEEVNRHDLSIIRDATECCSKSFHFASPRKGTFKLQAESEPTQKGSQLRFAFHPNSRHSTLLSAKHSLSLRAKNIVRHPQPRGLPENGRQRCKLLSKIGHFGHFFIFARHSARETLPNRVPASAIFQSIASLSRHRSVRCSSSRTESHSAKRFRLKPKMSIRTSSTHRREAPAYWRFSALGLPLFLQ